MILPIAIKIFLQKVTFRLSSPQLYPTIEHEDRNLNYW